MDALTPASGERRRQELEALLLLDALPGMGPRGVRAVVSAAGSARSAVALPGLVSEAAGKAAAAALGSGDAREAVLRALEVADRLGMATLLWTEDAYPRALLHLADPPPVLFLRGRAELLAAPGVAVVGSRRATARARSVAHDLGAAVAARQTMVPTPLAAS